MMCDTFVATSNFETRKSCLEQVLPAKLAQVRYMFLLQGPVTLPGEDQCSDLETRTSVLSQNSAATSRKWPLRAGLETAACCQ